MKINAIKSPFTFKGAIININAFSDVHGHIEKADRAYQAMVKNGAFEKGKRGKINFLINGGDWFISKGNIGFKNQKTKSFADYQLLMYNKFVETIKKAYPNTKTIFVPGSHEFDSGEALFTRLLQETNSRFISANLDFSQPPTLTFEDSSDKLTSATVDFVTDDKNPEVTYPILNIGISPINNNSYVRNTRRKTSFLQDNANEKHFLLTIQAVSSIIDKFKSQYPNGIVIATCHTGTEFARSLAAKSDIDIIFNAHEHKSFNEQIGKTRIINLSKDFDKIANVKLRIDDNGQVTDIDVKDMDTAQGKFRHTGAIGRYFNRLFGNEAKKTHTLICSNKTITELNTDNIRTANNNLANFTVDILLHQIREVDPDVNIFALNSSSIKSGFELTEGKNTSNLDILNCLTGISGQQGEIYTTKISGLELTEFILTNFLNNLVNEYENPIIQYAGIIINKTGMTRDYLSGKNFEELCRYITLKETGRTISPNGNYKIANTLKHFQKAEDEGNNILFGRSQATGYKLHDLFQGYFEKYEPVIFNTEKRIY